jgi:hypothetical protein
MRGALKGCGAVAALPGSPGAPALAAEDAVAIASAFLASVHVRSLAVTERLLGFQLLLALAQARPRPGGRWGVALAARAPRCSSTAQLPAAAAARAGHAATVADGWLRKSCGRGVQIP